MRKSQIDITNVLFMHIVGLLGIIAITFVFISLINSSESRASGLKSETIYHNYGRRLISTSDCFAYEDIELIYNVNNLEFYSRVKPGVIDISKFFDYNHQNCLRYDLVSGSKFGDPTNPLTTYPVLIYELNLKDLFTNDSFFTKNDVYKTIYSGQAYSMCGSVSQSQTTRDAIGSVGKCYYDCEELQKYIDCRNDINQPTHEDCIKGLKTIGTGVGGTPMIENLERDYASITPVFGGNCIDKSMMDLALQVKPYNNDFSCESMKNVILTATSGSTIEAGNVFETTEQYIVSIRYNNKTKFIEHPGVLNIKFCVIKIPTFCDSFFIEQNHGFNIDGITPSQQVYDEQKCKDLGLPLI